MSNNSSIIGNPVRFLLVLPYRIVSLISIIWLSLASGPAWATVTYDGTNGILAQIFNSNPEQACTNCHDSNLATGAPRSFAPDNVNFNTYIWATTGTSPNSNEERAVVRLTGATMPPTGSGDADLTNDTCGTANCSTLISQWQTDGFLENAPPTVTTTSGASSITTTTATVAGTVKENGTNVSVTFECTSASFGSCFSSGAASPSSPSGTGGGLESATNHTRALTGLSCGTTYNFNTDASGTNGTTRNFTTSSCSSPVIRINTTSTSSTPVTMDEDSSPTAFSLANLNAFDADGGNLTWSIFSAASNGTASVPAGTTTSTQNKTINYTPDPDYNGSDSFVVRVTDDRSLTDDITVNVTINSINDPPVIRINTTSTSSTPVTMDEDGSPTAFSLANLNAYDVDGGNLTWSINTAATNGTASVPAGTTTSTQNKTINYSPNADYNGPDSFVVRVTDSSSATDDITVNVTVTGIADDPIIRISTTDTASTAVVMSEDSNPTPFSLANLNAYDGDGGNLTWSINSAATNGTASVPAGTTTSTQNKTINYTPDLDYTGADSFVVRVTDNSARTDDITVNVTVLAGADPPVINISTTSTSSTAVVMSEDSNPTAFSLANLNATDVDGGNLTWSINTAASNGTASVPAGTTTSGENKTINYTPNADYNGSDSFVVRVTDDSFLTDDITVNVTVSSVDDPPVIRIITTSTASTNVAMSEDSNPTAFSLANLNAYDVDGGNLTWSIFTAASNGTASVPAGTTTSTQDKTINYSPNAEYNGADSFVVRVTDDSALTDDITVNVTIAAVNDTPVIRINTTSTAATTVSMSEDGSPTAFTLANLNAFDADGGNLTWSISSAASNGTASVPAGTTTSTENKTINYTPNANINGVAADSFEIQVSDDTALSDTITVTVDLNPENDPPIAADDSFVVTANSSNNEFDVIGNAGGGTDTDIDGDGLTITATSATDNGGTVVIGGSCTSNTLCYSPATDFDGIETFTYTIEDPSGASSIATVTVATSDTDGDGVRDFSDNCPNTVNPNQEDTDNDGIGDACDIDKEDDGQLEGYLEFSIDQGGTPGPFVVMANGTVTITASLTVPVDLTNFTFDWSNSNSTLLATATINNESFSFDPSVLSAGKFLVDLDLSDGSVGTHNELIITVLDTLPSSDNTFDCNADGSITFPEDDTDCDDDSVLNLADGFEDSDNDGIPDFLDSLDNSSSDNNRRLPNQTGDPDNSLFLETTDGLRITLGQTARFAGRSGATIIETDIENYGNSDGTAVSNFNDTYINIGGIFDFEITGLTSTGDSAQVVIPLHNTIRANSVYRKYRPSSGWQSFVEDTNNSVKSTTSFLGLCPTAGSPAYQDGLTPFDDCVQLTLEDGGPNDADGEANGVIRDPGGVAYLNTDDANNTSSNTSSTSYSGTGTTTTINNENSQSLGGGSSIHWFDLMFLLSSLLLMRRKKY